MRLRRHVDGRVDQELQQRLRLARRIHLLGQDGGEVAADGEGVGGGVYNLGLFDLDDTLIFGNLASTSDDDVFSI